MPTNLNIDDSLLDEARRIGGKRSKRETVNEALREYVQRRKQRQILDLFGTLHWDRGYTYKKDRER